MTSEAFDYYIPVRKSEIVSAILHHESLSAADRPELASVIRWLALLFHMEFFATSEHIKELYVGLNPDQKGTHPLETSHAQRQVFLEELDKVLIAANFRPLTNEEVEDADSKEGRLRSEIKVKTDVFSRVHFYARGLRDVETEVDKWFGLRSRKVMIPTFDHVVFAMIPGLNASKKDVKRAGLRQGAAYLQLFRSIPLADLKALYPNARAQVSWMRKAMIAASTVITGVPLLMKIIPALSVLLLVLAAYLGISGKVEEDSLKKAIASGTILAAFIGLGLRQWVSYDRHSLRQHKLLSDHAHSNKLNTNAGCFDYLIAASEDAEVKEAFMAYALLKFHDEPMEMDALDKLVEGWFQERFGIAIDFEIDDAIAKLERLSLIVRDGDTFRAVPFAKAVESCVDNWRLLSDNIARGGIEEDTLEFFKA
ncbi:MAG: DUF3754 domain-containing protein [Rhodobacteraceae bacterium]|nr:DUF3754 domain-containing protein [Paracoccaceae bacterium]